MAIDALTVGGANQQLSKGERWEKWEPALAWLGIGVGVAQLLMPRQVARVLGLSVGRSTTSTLRLCGAGQLLSGVGYVARAGSPSWRMARIGCQAINLAALGTALGTKKKRPWRRRSPGWSMGSALVGVAAVTALDAWGYRRATGRRAKELAPSHPLELRASITVDRPASALYSFWRDVDNLPSLMPSMGTVTKLSDTRSRWEVKGLAGTALPKLLSWEAAIVEELPGRLIRWQVEGGPAAAIVRGGEIRFVPAPGKQGTEVHVLLQAAGPEGASTLGRWAKKLPQRLMAQELRRFKQLMELGELTQAQARFEERVDEQGSAPSRSLPDRKDGKGEDRQTGAARQTGVAQ